MAAAAVGTAGGLYLVTKQDTSHTDSKQAKAQHTNVGEITYKNEGNTTPSKGQKKKSQTLPAELKLSRSSR